jgi:cell wall-associated NlpC family hydrolase
VINIVPGSTLPFYKDGQFKINNEKYEFPGSVIKPDPSKFKAELEAAAKFYLHAPYLWGGKSTFGIDCSGLTQMTFKHFGIKILRDARQQAEQGTEVKSIEDIELGDLAFFDNAEGKVIHVGIMLDAKTIIHASGRVKIDTFNEQGIYSKELERYTHKLHSVKRYI